VQRQAVENGNLSCVPRLYGSHSNEAGRRTLYELDHLQTSDLRTWFPSSTHRSAYSGQLPRYDLYVPINLALCGSSRLDGHLKNLPQFFFQPNPIESLPS